jgi:hypothetical protein
MGMTESRWLRSARPGELLDHVLGRASDRKLRLYAVACHRRLTVSRDPDETAEEQHVVALAERFADGLATAEELADAAPCREDPEYTSWLVADAEAVSAAKKFTTPGKNEPKQSIKAALLREVFGNPFREARLDPLWLSPTVASLAEAVYEERLPSCDLDPVRLGILADALVDAGCTEEAVLSHLRDPRPHVRGCWALDLCLKRG